MRLEDVDFLFEAGGITGGVLGKGGRLADRRGDLEEAHHRHDMLEQTNEKSGSGSLNGSSGETYEHAPKS